MLNIWYPTGSMNYQADLRTCITLQDGTILSMGGWNGTSCIAHSERYYPATGQWVVQGDMPVAKNLILAFVLANGKVLAVGGSLDDGTTPNANCALYDPSTGNWTATGSLGTARFGFGGWLLSNGNVLVAGGTTNGTTGSIATSELYNTSLGTWSFVGNLNNARAYFAYATSGSGIPVAIAGGIDSTVPSFTNTIESYNILGGTWTLKSSTLPAGAGVECDGNNFAITGKNGYIYIIGGRITYYSPTGSAYTGEYNVDTDTLTTKTSLNTSRVDEGIWLLSTGNILVAGGSSGSDFIFLNTSEIFDPVANTWTYVGNQFINRQIWNIMTGPSLLTGYPVLCGGDTGPYPGHYCVETEIFIPETTLTQVDNTQLSIEELTPYSKEQWNIMSNVVYTFTSAKTSNGSGYQDVVDLNASITPVNATSQVLVRASVNVYIAPTSGHTQACGLRIVRGASTVIATFGQVVLAGGGTITGEATGAQVLIEFLDTPKSTSSQAYKIQYAPDENTSISGTVSINDNSQETPVVSSLILQEIPSTGNL